MHVSGEDNVVADAISRLPTATTNQREPSTDALDSSGKVPAEEEVLVFDNNEAFPLNLSLVQWTQ